MARVIALPMGIMRISGKVGNVCFRTMKATGKVYVGRMPQARKTQPKAGELANQERFKKCARLVRLMREAGSRLSTKELWKIVTQTV